MQNVISKQNTINLFLHSSRELNIAIKPKLDKLKFL